MATFYTSDAVSRETAFLRTTGDGLPSLLASAGGPWQIIQAYVPRVRAARQSAVYVLRLPFRIERFANVRQKARYSFQLRVNWPLSSGVGSAEADQQAFDNAVDLLLQRVLGKQGDKTHGGAFLSVAESPSFLDWVQDDPEQTIGAAVAFSGVMAYQADDFEVIG